MTSSARELLQEALVLSEDERLELASEIIASVDRPRYADWEATWRAELDHRTAAAKARGDLLSALAATSAEYCHRQKGAAMAAPTSGRRLVSPSRRRGLSEA
jgi:putative addiction module component (TIGR02574 family)